MSTTRSQTQETDETHPQPQSQPDTQPQPQPQAQAQHEPQPQFEPQPQHELKPQPKPQTQPQPLPQAQAQPQPQTQPQLEFQPDPQPQPQPQPETQPQSQAQHEPQPHSQPQPQHEPQAQPELQHQEEHKSQLQPQPQPQPQSLTEAKSKVIEACGVLLSELRIRSMIGSYMMYEQSDKYGNLSFWVLIAASLLMGVATANLSQYIPVGDGLLPAISKIIIGVITVTTCTFKVGSMFPLEKFEKKQELANKTGAGWQELELNIRLFLDSADDTVTNEIYKGLYTTTERDMLSGKTREGHIQKVQRRIRSHFEAIYEKEIRSRTNSRRT